MLFSSSQNLHFKNDCWEKIWNSLSPLSKVLNKWGLVQTNLSYKFFRRSFSENLLSFFIFISFAFTIESFIFWIFSLATWDFINSNWIGKKLYFSFYTLYFFALAFSLWSLWKNQPFKTLKLETAFFMVISLLSILWNYTFLIKHDYFISLIASLFIFFSSIILNMLIWKKDKISAIIFSLSLIWASYLFIWNMSISITSY